MSKCKKIILSICAVFIAVFGVLFACFNNFDNNSVAYADSVSSNYSFVGGNTYFLPVFRNDPNGTNVFNTSYAKFSFYQNSNGVLIDPQVYVVNGSGTNNVSYSSRFVLYKFSDNSAQPTNSYFNIPFNTNTTFKCATSQTAARNFQFIPLLVKVNGNFNCNVYKIHSELSSNKINNDVYLIASVKCFDIYFYDVDDNYIQFQMFVPSNFIYESRTYYLSQDLSENQIYNQGYQQGLLDNQSNIYNNGYNAGNTAGYSNGYNDGLNSTDQYSFFNLFGAVLDAPVQTLIGLFNFQLFGVNLWSLFTALLTLSIILLIFRLVRGGK